MNIDLEGTITLGELASYQDGDNWVFLLNLQSENGEREEWLRIDRFEDNTFAVGQVTDYDPEDGSDVTYNLRNVRLFMRDYKLPGRMPLISDHAMIGPLSQINTLNLIRLVQACLQGQNDIREDLEYSFAVKFPDQVPPSLPQPPAKAGHLRLVNS